MDNAAAIITALSVLTTAMAGAFVLIYVALRGVKQKVNSIDHAVNGKDPGEATLVSQVDDLHKEIPIPVPDEVNGAALLPLVKLLVADMKARQVEEG